MASNSPISDDRSRTDTPTASCGHEVTASTACYMCEIRLCEDCYLDKDDPWFGLDDYPSVLQTKKGTAVEARGTNTITTRISLVGITNDRMALYHNKIDDCFWKVVPAHSDFHDTDDPIRAPLRDLTIDARLGAPPSFGRDEFHTLPNGDHLALVGVYEAPSEMSEWIPENINELRFLDAHYQPPYPE